MTPDLLTLILGNVGALVVLCIACYGLWRLLMLERSRGDKIDAQADTMLGILNSILQRLELADRLADEKEKWRREEP